MSVSLRDLRADDLPALFAQQADPEAQRMAAFVAKDASDRAAYVARWTRLLADETILKRAIVVGGRVVGSVASWVQDGEREVTYGVERALWGQGIATAALGQFLRDVPLRPLHARAAADNAGSIRVLERCGFQRVGQDRGFALARGAEVDEVIFRLG